VAIHPATGATSQDWANGPSVDSSFDRATHGRRQRDERHFVALAQDAKYAMSVHFLKRLNVGGGCFEDAQP
jgi:hypothetical protein